MFHQKITENVSLTLKDPIISESCIEIKIKLIFIFTLLCGASKGFIKALKAFITLRVKRSPKLSLI